jgi:Mce-associated membrane protein
VKTLAGEKEPRRQVSQNRARLVMVKKDSRWLVAELSTLLGNPPPG